jgi:hypothetical protein
VTRLSRRFRASLLIARQTFYAGGFWPGERGRDSNGVGFIIPPSATRHARERRRGRANLLRRLRKGQPAKGQEAEPDNKRIRLGGVRAMYELRINGRPVGVYNDQAAALARVRLFTDLDADAEIEVMDMRTGRAFEVAASVRWREEIAARMR